MMLKDFAEGSRGTVRVLVRDVFLKNGKNGPYHALTIFDSVTEKTVNAFSLSGDPFLYKGKVCDIDLEQGNYLNIKNIRDVEFPDYSPFIKHAVKDARETMDILKMNAANIKNDHLRMVTERLLNENEALYMHVAAGKTMHHDCVNGLLYHCYRMLKSSVSWCQTYHLDRDLMTAGILLHDIGKVKEMATDECGVTSYTVDGQFFGHLYMGPRMIEKACEDLGIDPNEEPIKMLLHMIVSHHGKEDFGAIKKPMFLEAFALHLIDDMDAKAWMFEEADKAIEPGCCSETKIYGIDNYVYCRTEKMRKTF